MDHRGRHSQLLRHDTSPEVDEGNQETSSGQRHPRPHLEVSACGCDLQREICRNPDRHTTRGNREPLVGQHIPSCIGYVYGIELTQSWQLRQSKEKETGTVKLPLCKIYQC